MAAHTVKKAKKDIACTVIESDPDATDYKPQQSLKSFVKPLFDLRSFIQHAIADLPVLTRTDVDGIVENHLSKCTNTLRSPILKAMESTLKEEWEANYFDSNIGLKSPLFNVVKQALGEVVWSDRVPTVSSKKVRSLVRTKDIVDSIILSVLLNMGCLFPIPETFEKMVYRAIDEYCEHRFKKDPRQLLTMTLR